MIKQHEEFLWNNRALIENLKTNNVIFSRLTQLKSDIFTIIREHCDGTNIVKLFDGTIEKPFTGVVNELNFSEHLIYRIHKDFKVKKPSIGKWVEFDIRGNRIKVGDFAYDVFDNVGKCLLDNHKFKAFGGVRYIEPISGELSAFCSVRPVHYVNSHGFMADDLHQNIEDMLPVYPHKIRFWVEE